MSKKKIFVCLFAVCLLFVLSSVGYIFLTKPDNLYSIDTDLAAYAPPEIPDDENASILFQELVQEFPGKQNYYDLMTEEYLQNIDQYDQDKIEALAEWNKQYQELFEKFDEAIQRPKASLHFLHDEISVQIKATDTLIHPFHQEIYEYQVIQKALWLRVIHEAYSSEIDQAYKHLTDMIRFARYTFEQHPLNTNFHIACSLSSMASIYLNELVQTKIPTLEQQQSILKEINQFDIKQKYLLSQKFQYAFDTQLTEEHLLISDNMSSLTNLPVLGPIYLKYLVINKRREDQKEVLRNLELMENYPKSILNIDELGEQKYILTVILFMALEPIAQLKAVELTFHLIQHKEKYGQYPETLKELSLDNQDLFIDPFSNEPFGYVNKDGKQILYSIFADLKDDNGKPWEFANFQNQQQMLSNPLYEGDLVWELP